MVSHILKAEREDFVLHDMSSVIVNHDIAIFLGYNLEVSRKERPLIDYLRIRSSPLKYICIHIQRFERN